ncbi:hypothetical protein RSWS8N_15714 [Cereibacter sphaeroides WS8N]|nr:hypothetical protein RSWS8N_15714 [Cereibacter sphaeroides WS8N]
MHETFASITIGNSKRLCIGGISRAEVREARASGLHLEDNGIYLFLASDSNPSLPIEVLAKFFSVEQAERAAELLPAHL